MKIRRKVGPARYPGILTQVDSRELAMGNGAGEILEFCISMRNVQCGNGDGGVSSVGLVTTPVNDPGTA